MNLRNAIIGFVLAVVVVVVAGLLYLQIAGGDGEVSQDIGDAAETIDNAGTGTLFRIQSERSEASFTLDEDLAGSRVTVVGSTDQVGGDIVINFSNPSASEIGTITINARDLETDSNFRNQALRARILQSAQEAYEFITFQPTALTGLPDSVEVGESYSFQIVGDLTIIETTNEVTFDATVLIVSETQIDGNATATITYGEWGIPVPTAPRVANVDEETVLEIIFVAIEVDEDEMTEATAEAEE